VIVDDLNVEGGVVIPAEADAPLVVDPDAPLAGAVAGKLFEPVAGRHAEEVEGCSAMELLQFALGDPLDILRQSRGKAAMKVFSVSLQENERIMVQC